MRGEKRKKMAKLGLNHSVGSKTSPATSGAGHAGRFCDGCARTCARDPPVALAPLPRGRRRHPRLAPAAATRAAPPSAAGRHPCGPASRRRRLLLGAWGPGRARASRVPPALCAGTRPRQAGKPGAPAPPTVPRTCTGARPSPAASTITGSTAHWCRVSTFFFQKHEVIVISF